MYASCGEDHLLVVLYRNINFGYIINNLVKIFSLFLRSASIFYLISAALLLFEFIQEISGVLHVVEFVNSSLSTPDLTIYILLFLVGIAETVFALSFYIPGSVVIFVVILSSPDKLITNYLSVVVFGFIVGVSLSYILGRYLTGLVDRLGHRRLIDYAKSTFRKYGILAVVALAAHPNYIGTLFVGIGGLRVGFWKYFLAALFALPVWAAIWTYAIREFNLEIAQLSVDGPSHTVILSATVAFIGTAYGIYRAVRLSYQ